jgi:RNA polymerase sigma factor (sigma-70 family)
MKPWKKIDSRHRFKCGEDDELSKLYHRYVHELYSYGLKIHSDDQMVKDCIQEVFIHLIDKRKDSAISDITPVYLFKSLRNKLLEELRSKSRRTEIVKSITFNVNTHEMSAEQLTVLSEEEEYRTRIIEEALNTLSPYQKEAIFLKYSQGFEYEEMAELLEIDVASARTLIYRSLKRVKESMVHNHQIFFLFFRSRPR